MKALALMKVIVLPMDTSNEFPELENSIIPQVNPIPPQVNPIPPQVNPIPSQVNPIPPQVNPIPPQVNPIPPGQNNNNPNDEVNMLYKNIATLILQHFAQNNVQFPNNINGQNDGQIKTNGPVQDNNQINNDSTVRIKRILLNQLLQLYDPPRQDQRANNQQNSQYQNQPPK